MSNFSRANEFIQLFETRNQNDDTQVSMNPQQDTESRDLQSKLLRLPRLSPERVLEFQGEWLSPEEAVALGLTDPID